MPDNIFDLETVRALIGDKQPLAVIVADTNILMNWPDFSKWETSFGEVVFVLPSIINLELQRLKMKNQNKEGRDPASEATRSFRNLCKKGSIDHGIYLGGVGWFVSVPYPMEDRMSPALKQWATVVQSYGRPDLMFLLLTRELAQLSSVPIILATADSGLFGLLKSNGIPAYHFQGFPITDLGESLSEPPLRVRIDWDKKLSDIQQEAEKKFISVDLILTSKRAIPRSFRRTFENMPEHSPLPQDPLLFAEGVGTVQLDRDIGFSWALSYSEWDYPFLRPYADEELEPQPAFWTEVHLNFGGREHEVSDDVRAALAAKLQMLTFPLAGWLGLPTVLGPESILKFFFYITYLSESLSSEGGTEDDMKREFANEYRETSELATFGAHIIFWRLGINPKESRAGDSLKRLLTALTSSWGMGEKRVIRLAMDSPRRY